LRRAKDGLEAQVEELIQKSDGENSKSSGLEKIKKKFRI